MCDKYIFKSYGYKVISLNNINDITQNKNSNNVYSYKNVRFLLKTLEKNDTLVISFHGAVKSNNNGLKKIIFRGYNIPESLCDTLCISDALMNIYKHYSCNWYLSTNKYNFEPTYQEIIKYIISMKKYKNVIFTGTSAGAYPALLYASLFNKTALLGNPILYPEIYGLDRLKKNKIVHYYKHKQLLNENNDELLYNEKDIEKNLLENKPDKIIYYQNIKDGHFDTSCMPFINFIKGTNIDISLKLFNPKCTVPFKKQHSIVFPYGGLLDTITIIMNNLKI
jgi:hypothetical protein